MARILEIFKHEHYDDVMWCHVTYYDDDVMWPVVLQDADEAFNFYLDENSAKEALSESLLPSLSPPWVFTYTFWKPVFGNPFVSF